VGVTHHNIGLIHMCVGSFGDALDHFQRAVEIRTKCLPCNHPDIVVRKRTTLEGRGVKICLLASTTISSCLTFLFLP
jgi:hypothetical protein